MKVRQKEKINLDPYFLEHLVNERKNLVISKETREMLSKTNIIIRDKFWSLFQKNKSFAFIIGTIQHLYKIKKWKLKNNFKITQQEIIDFLVNGNSISRRGIKNALKRLMKMGLIIFKNQIGFRLSDDFYKNKILKKGEIYVRLNSFKKWTIFLIEGFTGAWNSKRIEHCSFYGFGDSNLARTFSKNFRHNNLNISSLKAGIWKQIYNDTLKSSFKTFSNKFFIGSKKQIRNSLKLIATMLGVDFHKCFPVIRSFNTLVNKFTTERYFIHSI